MATEKEVRKLITSVMPLFANYRPPDNEDDALALVKAWHMVIGHLEPDVISAALRAAVTRTEFFPTPKLVLELAVELTVAPKRSGADAWGDVTTAINTHHSYHPPDMDGGALDATNYRWSFADPIVGKVVRGMGWLYLCMSTDQMADRAHFIKAYEQERDRAHADGRLTPELIEFRDKSAAGPLLLGTTEPTEISLRPAYERSKQAAQLTAGIGKGTR